ncbi:conserved hypothetical protein [Tenacibaculum sediminilitoris]|uniref:response regulator n=1 Tax=Tenacibaculum sediminilitoris TaxID=1820334 RepID=UPI00389613AC
MRKIKGLDCILLIDDEEINNYLNIKLIEKLKIDVHVEVALNGKLGLEYLTCSGKYHYNKCSPQPGLIFLDINMPLMNGWQFLDEYKNLNEDLKTQHVIAMLSASNNPDDINRANSKGDLVEFINKPLTVQKLEEIIYKFFPQDA